MTIYYTYCSYETDKGDEGLMYIGKRKCPKDETPWTDSYYGSQKSKKNQDFKNNPNKSKVILGLFETDAEALAHEIELQKFYDVAKSPRFANQAIQTSTGFSTEGRTGERNPMFGRTGEKAPMFGRTGEKCPAFGRKDSPKTRAKKSESKRGSKNPFYGKGHKDETRAKISANHADVSGEKNPMFGVRGSNSPNFDHSLYDFENKSLGIVESQVTKSQMKEKHGVNPSNLGRVVRGQRVSCGGWSVKDSA